MLRITILPVIILLLSNSIAYSQTNVPELAFLADAETNQAFLGIMSEKVSKEKARKLGSDNPYGSYVSEVIPNTAAEKAGIRPFDYIFGIDDAVTSRRDNLADLLSNYEPGDQVRVQLMRSGKQKTMRATLGTREEASYTKISVDEKPFFGVAPSSEMNGELSGARINVVEGSSAEELGLQNGDRIVQFNTYRVFDWLDLTMAINTVKAGQSVSIRYIRNGKEDKTAGTMGAAATRRATVEAPRISPPNPPENSVLLGVVSDRLPSEKAEKLGLENPYGYYVTEIVPGSAADKAGVRPFDYIYGIDQYRVGAEAALVSMLRKYKPGDRVQLHLVRQNKPMSLPVTLTSREDVPKVDKKKKRNDCEKPFLGVMQGYDSDPNQIAGVQVNIVENSTAAAIGLEDGDIITHINRDHIIDWDDITIALQMVKPGESIEITYSRQGGYAQTAKGTIRSYAETKECENCDCGKAGIQIDIDMDELEEDLESLEEELEELGEDLGDMIQIRTRRGYEIATVDVEDYEVSISKAGSNEISQLSQVSGQSIPQTQDLSLGSIRIATYPEDQEFRLAFELNDSGNTTVDIYNPEGRRIYQYAADNFSGLFEDTVNVGQNGAGDYYLHIQQDGQHTVRVIRVTQR